jgi:uncharacterized protein YeeX (DUF496 family)
LEGSIEKEHLEMILEDISGKFDLVLEGYAALDRKLEARFDQLNEKIEDNSFKIDILNKKIDYVADDLSAHRRDTEVHRGYQVRED